MSWLKCLEYYEELRRATEQRARTTLSAIEERELFMDGLRQFKHSEESKRFDDYQKQKTDMEQMLFALTALAQVCLQETYLFESARLRQVYGKPNSHFHMVAMGKFGGCEMSLQSDLDLIFIFAEHAETSGPKVITNQEYFAKLVQRIISNLSLLTAKGRAYEVDARLRPSGRSGILVCSWESFEDYHQKRAQIWEKQALLKSRPIEPEANVYWNVHRHLRSQIWNRDFGPEIRAEIHRIRGRMEQEISKEDDDHYDIKVGPGALVDVEFAVQYLQLKYGAENESIGAPHTLTALRALRDASKIDAATAQCLEESYLFYRQLETYMRHLEKRSVSHLPRKKGEILELLAHFMTEDVDHLIARFEDARRHVRQIYGKIFGLD